MDKEKVFEFILDLDHYATWDEVIVRFGLINATETERALGILLDDCNIIRDDSDDTLIVTRVTNPKLQKLIDESVRLK